MAARRRHGTSFATEPEFEDSVKATTFRLVPRSHV
jgi:hypothetical protein